MSEVIEEPGAQQAGQFDHGHSSSSTLNPEENTIITNNETELKKEGNADAEKDEGETSSQDSATEWRFTTRAKLVFSTLAMLALMVSLDGTSISVALPVRSLHFSFLCFSFSN
jgi:hypothetical protein